MSAAIPLPYIQNTPDWEEARRDSIGSSDISVITGSAPASYGSRLEMWALKTRRIDERPIDESTQELFALGHALEPVIAARYTATYGRPVRQVRRMLRHPDIEWATASLDRVSAVKGERLIVEIKWDPWARFSAADEGVPPHVMEQVQWQLLVTGYEAADVAVLKGSRVDRIAVPPDATFQENLLWFAERFREEHIVPGIPPKADGSEATRLALARLYPGDDGEMMDPTAELHGLMAELHEALPALKAADERVGSIKNSLRLALQDHAGSESDDWKITHKRTKDGSRTDWKAVATAYRKELDEGHGTASEFLDAVESLHTNTTEGSRRLVPTWKKHEEEGSSWT